MTRINLNMRHIYISRKALSNTFLGLAIEPSKAILSVTYIITTILSLLLKFLGQTDRPQIYTIKNTDVFSSLFRYDMIVAITEKTINDQLKHLANLDVGVIRTE